MSGAGRPAAHEHAARDRTRAASLSPVIDEFEADIEVRGPDLWVLPKGDLDITATPDLQDALRLALASDATSIVIDLRGIDFLDSTGLRALLEARAEEGG